MRSLAPIARTHPAAARPTAGGLAAGMPSPRRVQPRRPTAHAAATETEEAEVFIRRAPPEGQASQPCGTMQFTTAQSPDAAPRNILEEIVWWKATEVAAMRDKRPLAAVMAAAAGAPPPRDFIGALRAAAAATGRPGLIAEVKKASPSKGVIQPDFDPVRIARAYEAGGAACLSVLTDAKYFQGAFENLTLIRAAGVACPLLCKEFIVEAYQLFAARAAGADAVLLIAAVLPNADLDLFLRACRKIGLQALVEVHTPAEMERVLKLDLDGAMLGINNRDLGTFKVDLKVTDDIMASPPGRDAAARGLLVAGESGIFTPADVASVAAAGCGAILVGESLVKQGDPEAGVKALLA